MISYNKFNFILSSDFTLFNAVYYYLLDLFIGNIDSRSNPVYIHLPYTATPFEHGRVV